MLLMDMKKLSVIIVLFSVVALSVVGFAQGATTGTVAATVTAQNVSVTVTSGTVAYGALAANTSKSTIATDLNNTQVASNSGNVPEDFVIAGTNSTGWTLGATAGVNTYVHQFCTTGCTTPPTNFTALTTSNQALANILAAGATQNFDLRITTPTSSSVTTQQAVNVVITATAH